MSKGRGLAWCVLVLAVALVFSFGCTKKQAVKPSETQPAAAGAGKEAPGKGIATEEMKPAATAPADEKKLAASEAGAAVTEEKPSPFADIRFDFDKSFIRDDAKPTLAKVAEYIKKNKGAKILVEGHCDERGTSEYNMALGDRRAASAKKYLESLGVPAASLSTISFGKEKPVDPGHTEEAWAKNRRDHFVLK
ncbi:MAG: peptidoglycan-associated lipoprotein Pal [Deltaproteobacteria bacterium]|nr:peptidoglycan-associated lipoprotein Pal [Deltaproteobacteria bacterium]